MWIFAFSQCGIVSYNRLFEPCLNRSQVWASYDCMRQCKLGQFFSFWNKGSGIDQTYHILIYHWFTRESKRFKVLIHVTLPLYISVDRVTERVVVQITLKEFLQANWMLWIYQQYIHWFERSKRLYMMSRKNIRNV